eukprot:augustus_masked-scaffold_5-processed-gene-10.56-mRNA-1 protein AED:0.01 eAED:0.01 QI:0/-1/0/1/-1/1/1/0/746
MSDTTLTPAPISNGDDLIKYDSKDAPFTRILKEELRPIKYAKTGLASMETMSFPKFFNKACGMQPDTVALRAEWPEPKFDPENREASLQSRPIEEWKCWTYAEMQKFSRAAAKGFISLGLDKLSTVSCLGFNSPFYAFACYGAMLAGGVYNGMYATDSIEQIKYKCEVSGTQVACVDTVKNLNKFIEVSKSYPKLKAIIVWKEVENISDFKNAAVSVLSWEEFIKISEELEDGDDKLDKIIENIQPESCCSTVFTSGTTGKPKAVMISHDNFYYMSLLLHRLLPEKLWEKPVIRMVSYLPLSHIAAFILDFAAVLIIPIEGKRPMQVHFVRSYDMKVGGLLPRLQAVRPNYFFGVPRVWEKFEEGIRAKAQTTGILAKLLSYAKGKMFEKVYNQQIGESGTEPWGIGISKMLINKVQKKLGLDDLVYAGTGAAAMKLETTEFWASLGIEVRELCGMSENSGAAMSNGDVAVQWSTCGFSLPGTEVKVFRVDHDDVNKKTECPAVPNDLFVQGTAHIDEKYQGELCYRGRHIMIGYLANPELGEEHVKTVERQTANTVDNEGWLHTGDKGCISELNMIKVTGRYKEIILGSGGENIAPVPIEDDLKRRCPAISNVVMIGNGQKYNIALITLKCEGATGEKPGTDKLTGPALGFGGSDATTLAEVVKSDKYTNALETALKETNENGEVILNNTFKIQKIGLLPFDLSVEGDELTATLKLKRSVVESKYKSIVDKIYSEAGVFIDTISS